MFTRQVFQETTTGCEKGMEIMKLKYKKIILLTTMSTMGIGMLTLSLSNDKSRAEENSNVKTVYEEQLEDGNTLAADDNNRVMAALAEATATPTPSPTPTPIPVYPIEEPGTYPEIDALLESYYNAKNNLDINTLKSLLSDPNAASSEEELQMKTEYIEDYRNVKAYTKKGMKEGTYIVYAYHEIKFTGINTPAPGLAKFYVVTGEDNKLKIFSGDMDTETKAYYDIRNEDEDVAALISMTDERSKQAIEKDEDLHSFWESIDKMANKAEDTAQDPTEGSEQAE